MDLSFSFLPDIEDILVTQLKKFLFELVKFQELFPRQAPVRVSQVHPFASLIDQELAGVQTPMELFPSVTVLSQTDSKTISYPVTWDEEKVTSDDLQNLASPGWIFTPTDKTALETLTGTEGAYGTSVTTTRTHRCVLEIWAQNITVKNKIFDFCELFLAGWGRLELEKSKGIKIHEYEITGQRSGFYNYDFGKILFGGNISFSVDLPLYQLLVNSETGAPAKIQHTYKDIR